MRVLRRRATIAMLGRCLGLWLAAAAAAAAASSVSAAWLPPVLFGQTASLSGASSSLGLDVQCGLRVALTRANDGGGVHGRELQLRTLDDGYDPAPALDNTRALLDNYTALAIVGVVGTAPAQAILPWLHAARVPLLGPVTGARSLRAAASPAAQFSVVNLRASYDDEILAFVEHCLRQGYTSFSLLRQNDGFGTAGQQALDVALRNNGLAILSVASYTRNTLDVEAAWQQLQQGLKPDVCVLIGTAGALAKFVALARSSANASTTAVGSGAGQAWSSVLFGTVSFVGPESLGAELLAANTSVEGMVVMQVLPPPRSMAQLQRDAVALNDSSLLAPTSLLFQFASAIQGTSASLGCNTTSGTFEGYLLGSMLVQTLQRMGPLNDATLLQYLRAGEFYDATLASFVDLAALDSTLSSWPASSPVYLNDTLFAPLVRDLLMKTAYESKFGQGGLIFGPLQQPASCNATLQGPGCLASSATIPCNQLSSTVYLSTMSLQSVPGLPAIDFREHVSSRLSWSECDVHSKYIAASARPIVLGQTAVFSGQDFDLGVQMKRGIRGAFEESNRAGGIRGRRMMLLSYDDGYTPGQAVANVAEMVANDRVMGIIGVTGTAPATAILASGWLNRTGTAANQTSISTPLALLGSFTGARSLRSPFLRHVINMRAGYDDEIAAQIDSILASFAGTASGAAAMAAGWRPSFYLLRQNDAFGTAGENALRLALAYHKLQLACVASYVRGTSAVAPALARMQACVANSTNTIPSAIIMVGTAAPLAAFVALAEVAWISAPPLYTAVSFVGSEAFLAAVDPAIAASGRILISQVVPPVQTTLTPELAARFPILARFQAAMRAAGDVAPLTFGALEGYIVGRMAVYAAVRSTADGSSFTRSSLIDPFYQAKMVDLGDGLVLGPFDDGQQVALGVGQAGTVTATASRTSQTKHAAYSALQTASVSSSAAMVLQQTLLSPSALQQQQQPLYAACNQGFRAVFLTTLPTFALQSIYNAGSSSSSSSSSILTSSVVSGSLECGVLRLYSDLPCPAGYEKLYTSANSSLASVCQPCAPGMISQVGGVCDSCAQGTYSSETASNSCLACRVGTYQDRLGQTGCLQCDVLSYAAAPNATLCTLCEPNAHTNMVGASSNDMCACMPGFFVAAADSLPRDTTTGLTLPRSALPAAVLASIMPTLVVTSSGSLQWQDGSYFDCQPCPNPRWADPGQSCQLQPMRPLTAARLPLAVLCGLLLVLVLLCASLVWCWRALKSLKAATPALMGAMCVGALAALLVPILSAEYPVSSDICRAQLFLGHVGWVLIFGAATLKAHRLHAIFLQGRRKFKMVRITTGRLMRQLAAMITAQITYLVVWQVVSPVGSVFRRSEETEFYWCAQQDSHASSLWAAIPLVFDALILMCGCYYCYQIRSFEGPWLESKELGVVSYNTALVSALALAGTYVLVQNDNAFQILLSATVILVIGVMITILFGGKLISARREMLSLRATSASAGGALSKGTLASAPVDQQYHDGSDVDTGSSTDTASGAMGVGGVGTGGGSNGGGAQISDGDVLSPAQVRALRVQLGEEKRRVHMLQSRLRNRPPSTLDRADAAGAGCGSVLSSLPDGSARVSTVAGTSGVRLVPTLAAQSRGGSFSHSAPGSGGAGAGAQHTLHSPSHLQAQCPSGQPSPLHAPCNEAIAAVSTMALRQTSAAKSRTNGASRNSRRTTAQLTSSVPALPDPVPPSASDATLASPSSRGLHVEIRSHDGGGGVVKLHMRSASLDDALQPPGMMRQAQQMHAQTSQPQPPSLEEIGTPLPSAFRTMDATAAQPSTIEAEGAASASAAEQT